MLLLPYSGTYEILTTDFHYWRQPGTGRWGKWDTPAEENTQRVSDLRWLLGLSRAAGSQGTFLLCKCLSQEASTLYDFGPVPKALMPTKHDLESLFLRHSLPTPKLERGLEFAPVLAVLDRPLLFEASGGMGRSWRPLDQFLTYLLPCQVCQLLRSELFQACLLNWQ